MKIIPYGRQSINDQDMDAVCSVLRSDWLTQGPKVREFEEALCEQCGAGYCIAVSNGTMALQLACMALDIEPGDVGLTSPISFLASANCITYCGGKADFADIDRRTLCLSPQKVEEYCEKNTPPRVVIPVDFAGIPADLPRFQRLSEKYGFKIIEDAAHAIGSTYSYKGNDYACGSCSHTDLAVYSFHPVKTITTGEGGAILTNYEDLALKLRRLANHGMERDPSKFINPQSPPLPSHRKRDLRYASTIIPASQSQKTGSTLSFDNQQSTINNQQSTINNQQSTINNQQSFPSWYHEMQDLGLNGRITDIQCALGLSQLKRLGEFKAKRQEIVKRYKQAFKKLEDEGVVVLPPWPEGADPCYHLYPLRLGPNCKIHRDELFIKLRGKGIYCQVHYIPIYHQPFYRERYHFSLDRFPEAEKYFESCISLPLFPDMDDDIFDYVIDSLFPLL